MGGFCLLVELHREGSPCSLRSRLVFKHNARSIEDGVELCYVALHVVTLLDLVLDQFITVMVVNFVVMVWFSFLWWYC